MNDRVSPTEGMQAIAAAVESGEGTQPGYVDLQVNGYAGVDFNDPQTTVQQIASAARAIQAEGVQVAFPTVITADIDSMCACIRRLVEASSDDETCASLFQGIHIEGPFLSPVAGFIGAHPVACALASDAKSLEKLLDEGGPMVRLLTLAPEIDVGAKLTRICRERGVLVAAGHTDASLGELETCLDAGLCLFTHLANACPKLLDRHDNIIQRALYFRDRLWYSLIADGFHVPAVLFSNFLHALPTERTLVVSDAISAAGLGPGTYQLGSRTVEVTADKAARDASAQHFVGAASSMRDADRWLRDELKVTSDLRRKLTRANALRLLHGNFETV